MDWLIAACKRAIELHEHIVYQSGTERTFAEQLETNEAIKACAKLPGWFMRFQAGIIGVFRQAPESRLDLQLQRRVLPDHAAERPFKPGRGNKLGHGSFAFPQVGDEAFS